MFLPARIADSVLLQPRGHRSPRRLLTVADPRVGDEIATLAGYWGHQALLVPGFREALDCLPALKPDVVVVETLSSRPGGLKFASQLRAGDFRPEFLVAVVAGADASQRRMLQWAGYDHIVEEPARFAGLRVLLDCPRRRPAPNANWVADAGTGPGYPPPRSLLHVAARR